MKSPFKFLDSYTLTDREIFFGRDREIEELYHRVFESKIMLVYGVSGTGKSSLIHCGLANKFSETDWLPIVIRRGGNIIESMAAGIKSSSITQQQDKFISPIDFKKGIRSLYLDYYKPVFFIFDQFEELFIFGDKEERRSFAQIVKSLNESDLQCRLIFVMREEYMAGVTEFEKYVPAFFANRVRIEKMSHLNAIEAIKGPCVVFNIDLEEGFAEALLEKLSPGSEEVELTYLQVFLDKIFKISTENSGVEGKISFTNKLLTNAGNVKDILGSFLDEQVSLLPDPVLSMTVLKSFVSLKGTKLPATFKEAIDNVKSLGKEIAPETLKDLLLTFIKLRLLTEKNSEGRYELRHDSLAEKIFEKFSLAEKEFIELKRFIENAFQVYQSRNILLNSDDLNYISNKDSFLTLNEELKEFLKESKKNQVASKETLKRLITVSAVAIIILLSTIGITISRRTKVSNATRIAFESIYQFTNPVDRLCMAACAWDTHKGNYSKGALMEAFNYMIKHPEQDQRNDSTKDTYLKVFAPISSHIEYAGCSRDNKFIYGYTKDSVIIWEVSGVLRSKFKIGALPLTNLQMDNNSQYIGGVTCDSDLKIWDLNGEIKFTKKIRYNPINECQTFRFTKDNKIVALSENHDAEIWDINGRSIQTLDFHKGSVNGLDISDDGLFIATASSDSTINIWYKNKNTKNYAFYDTINSHSDTVWSVDFAPNSRYIVSTSKDRSVMVTSVNNNLVWSRRRMYFYSNLFKDRLPLYPVFAEFDDTGTGVTIKSFENKDSNHKQFMVATYFDINEANAIAGRDEKFDNLSFSPDKQYFAYVTGNKASLVSRFQFVTSPYSIFTNHHLLELEGKKPFFSSDGKYVYTISGNHIECWFIDIKTISQVAMEFYKKWGTMLY